MNILRPKPVRSLQGVLAGCGIKAFTKGVSGLDAAIYKCPNCNADLKFDPVTQKLSCEYCLSSFTIDEIKKLCAETETVYPMRLKYSFSRILRSIPISITVQAAERI